jgi:hypothetical protein
VLLIIVLVVFSKLAHVHAADSSRGLVFGFDFAFAAKQCSEGGLVGNPHATLTCTLASDLTQTASLVAIFRLLGIVP